MPRWIAIGTAPGWDDIKKFGEELHEPRNWHPDARTTIKRSSLLVMVACWRSATQGTRRTSMPGYSRRDGL